MDSQTLDSDLSEVKPRDLFKALPDFSDVQILPGHAEYLSDGWLQEARTYLDREVAMRSDALAGKPFSVSGIYTDAPPHLGFKGNMATWSLTYRDDQITVSRQSNAGADLVLEGKYQAGLCLAQIVGAATPGRMERGHRMVAAMMGDACLRYSGGIGDEAVRWLLEDFHDHMGRITVENPDLAHRAEQFGMTNKIRFIIENGYAVLESVLPEDVVAEAREQTMIAASQSSRAGRLQMLREGRIFEDILLNPALLTLVDATLNRGALICGTSCIVRGPGAGTIEPHTDYSFVPEPFPEYSLGGVAVWALDDWTEASGPTWILPKSHLKRRHPRPGEVSNGDGVAIEMPKGSVVLFGEGTWHWQGDRTQPGQRVSLHNHYIRGVMRTYDPIPVDDYMLHRNSPRLAELSGLHDFFGKLGPRTDLAKVDRDYVKRGYMLNLHRRTDRAQAQIMGVAPRMLVR